MVVTYNLVGLLRSDRLPIVMGDRLRVSENVLERGI